MTWLPVRVVLDDLVAEQALVDVVAERAAGEVAALEGLDRLLQAAGQHLDAALLALRRREFEDVLLRRRAERVLALDAFEAGGEHHGEREVGVAGGVRRAVLDARADLLAGLVLGHADEVAAVAARPRQVHRRFVAGDEALVAVHPLVRDERELRRVAQHAGHVRLRDRREVVLVGLVEEGVAVALEQRLVRVHAAAVLVGERLRHEGGVDVVRERDLLHDEAVRHRAVGHRQRVGVAQVDLVLATARPRGASTRRRCPSPRGS